jgi:polysaccharide export outer membrane protein
MNKTHFYIMNSRFTIKAIQLCLYLAIVSLSSCVSFKNVPYFQDLDKSKTITEDIKNTTPHIIQPKDELLIHVTSLNPDASIIFNNNTQTSTSSPYIPVYDYLVDQKGEINLPDIGIIKVAGLTTDQLSTQLNQSLTQYLGKPIVSVRIINFKVAVLGDVAHPGIYSSNSERLTVTEALSLSGDLNITAERNSILLVREINGKREFYHIDITSKNLFESPCFYLKSNDLIFVQPGKLKVSTLESTGYRNASLIISALSVVVTLAYLISTHK